MGKTLDALLGRKFNTSKLNKLAKTAALRAAVLKNQQQTRASQARSDVAQLLNLGREEQALLRVEHVIKERNMADVFSMVEGYCRLLAERVSLIRRNKEFPEELREAISGLIFVSARVGRFPELLHIREIFTLTLGKEYTAGAIELHNNHDVDLKIIQKLSTRRASLETQLKILKEIASENGMSLHLEEDVSVISKTKKLNQIERQPEPNESAKTDESKLYDDDNHGLSEVIKNDEIFSGSLESKKKNNDAARSAGYAAVAARAVAELSLTKTRENPRDQKVNEHATSEENDHPLRSCSGKFHAIYDFSSESEDEDSDTNSYGSQLEKQEHGGLHNGLVDGSPSTSNSDSDGESLTTWKVSYHSRGKSKPFHWR